MSDLSASSRGNWSSGEPEGWGPPTSVRAGGHEQPDYAARPSDERPRPAAGSEADRGWSSPRPAVGREQRAERRADQRIEEQIERMGHSRAQVDQAPSAYARPHERGLPWWAALLVLVVVSVLGGIIDTVGAFNVSNGFNIGIVVASVIAILVVKRSHMFPIVIAPPIVYSVATAFQLYIRSNGLSDRKVIFDAAANYLVYGFPAIAAATAAVLIIAGVRLIVRR